MDKWIKGINREKQGFSGIRINRNPGIRQKEEVYPQLIHILWINSGMVDKFRKEKQRSISCTKNEIIITIYCISENHDFYRHFSVFF